MAPGSFREAVFFSSDLDALAFFLRGQFFKVAKPFLHHALGEELQNAFVNDLLQCHFLYKLGSHWAFFISWLRAVLLPL